MPLDSTTIIEKRAGEKLFVGMDFGSWLEPGETITGITSVAVIGDGASVTVTSQTVSGSRVVFFVDGGEAGVRYMVKVTITTSSNQTLIGEGPLKVI